MTRCRWKSPAKRRTHEYLLRASGSAVKFPGFLVVYEEAKNEDVKSEEDEENVRIPAGCGGRSEAGIWSA